MIIKKFQGPTEVDALTKAKEELGSEAVIMNIKTIKPRGLKKLFKPTVVEVTAALDEVEKKVNKAEKIDYVADEEINLKKLEEKEGLEAKLENLQMLLEQQLHETTDNKNEEKKEGIVVKEKTKEDKKGSFQFVKMIYNIMLQNEIDEKYANQVIDEVEKIMRNDTQIDYLLSNIYQKLILKFGKPTGIKFSGNGPKVVFFIGPTGVGKTTTIAKLASVFQLEHKKKVAFLTADTYRIAAPEQLRTYANILNAPLSICYTPEDIKDTLDNYKDYDLVLVDTAGYSHKNTEQQLQIKQLIDSVDEKYDKEIYLVLSATTKYNDLKNIADSYAEITDYNIIFTKLDETSTYGNILNIKLYTGAELSYSTNGQNVPNDVEIFNSQKIVKLLLGGKQ